MYTKTKNHRFKTKHKASLNHFYAKCSKAHHNYKYCNLWDTNTKDNKSPLSNGEGVGVRLLL